MRVKGCYVDVSKILVFFGVHHELLNEDTHIINGKHAGVLTVETISFIRIFMRVASRIKGGIKRQCGCRQRQFPVLSLVSSLESLQALRQGQQ